jgi:hypothetical protein
MPRAYVLTTVFRDVPEFPGYRIGDDGTMLSCLKRGGNAFILTREWRRLACYDKQGYRYIRLQRADGTSHQRQVHRIVLEAFIGPCPAGMEACHNNGVRSDNRLDNLRWDTRKNNLADRVRHGTVNRGERHGRSKLSAEQVRQLRDLHASGVDMVTLGTLFQVAPTTIFAVVHRHTWQMV